MNIKSKYKAKKICIIGAGKVGSAFFHSLRESGYDIRYIFDSNNIRLKKIISGSKNVKAGKKITRESLSESDVIVFAVQEKKLKSAIGECRKFNLDLSAKIIFHLSGIETSGLFGSLKHNAMNTGSFHPLQTFNNISYKYSNILSNIYFGIEGGKNALKYFREICKCLKSDFVIIPKDKKILYHSSCVIASNFLVSHFNVLSKISGELFKNRKIGVEIYKPIIMTTLDNIFNQGIDDSLTGPFERGDISTIKLHLKYFKEKLPYLAYYYILFGLETTNLSLQKKSITKKEAGEIEKLLLKYI